MKKKIYLYLCGGLGNQLFQYAAARNLAIKNNAELILDTVSGFITDFIWFNRFNLNLKFKNNKNFYRIVFVFWIYRFYKIFFKKKLISKFFGYSLIDETSINYYEKKIININFNKNLYMMGFYQVDKYFLENSNTILKELRPKLPNNKNFLALKKKIILKNSISIGIRIYQDVKNKNLLKFGGLTDINFYEKAINIFKKKIHKPNFFIFSKDSADVKNFIKKLKILSQYPINIITSDRGYSGDSENLWLMSNCRNHIISNSSFYWWGAYFSRLNYKTTKVICADNFINQDTRPKTWKY